MLDPLYVLLKKNTAHDNYSFFIFRDAFFLSITVNIFIFTVSSGRRNILDPTLGRVTAHKPAFLLVEEFSEGLFRSQNFILKNVTSNIWTHAWSTK